MAKWQGAARPVCRRLVWNLMAGVAIAGLAAGCTKLGKKDTPAAQLAAMNYTKKAERPPLKPTHPLYAATSRWAREHQKNPADPNAALNYARNLRAIGSKEKALGVLARTYQLNRGNGALASEYGRLALDMGKTEMAERLLNEARNAKGQTDWRVISALGTIHAQRGDHKTAQEYYMAALRQQPGATSIYNNLALSYALNGKVGDAETLLKRAIDKGHNTERVRQNLALVLGLQRKFGESQQIAQADLGKDKVDNNVSFLRNMVKATKVARAAKAPDRKREQKAGTITTAALPRNKPADAAGETTAQAPVPKRKPAAPVETAAVKEKSPDAVKRDENKTAANADASGTRLPWRAQAPSAAAPQRTAELATAAASAASPNWSMTVTEGSGGSQASAGKKSKPFNPWKAE